MKPTRYENDRVQKYAITSKINALIITGGDQVKLEFWIYKVREQI